MIDGLTEHMSHRYTDDMLSCILLAAGQSQRFGSVKALVERDGQTIITLLQKALLDANFNEIVVVLGAHADKIEPFLLNHSRVTIVYNKDHKFGQTSSFQCGLRKVSDQIHGIALLPVDFPLLQAATLREIGDAYLSSSSKIVIPSYKGRRGHPPIFPYDLKKEFLTLDVQEGLNTIQHRYEDRCMEFEVDDPAVITSFNTPLEWEEIKRAW